MASPATTNPPLDLEHRVLVTQATVLESVARGKDLTDVLQETCKLIEGHSPGALLKHYRFQFLMILLILMESSRLPLVVRKMIHHLLYGGRTALGK